VVNGHGVMSWLRKTTARCGQHFSTSPDLPDVGCADLPGLHFEVKAVERLNVTQAMAQAVGDAGGKAPLWRISATGGEWLVTMRAAHWFAMLASGHGAQQADTERPLAMHQAG